MEKVQILQGWVYNLSLYLQTPSLGRTPTPASLGALLRLLSLKASGVYDVVEVSCPSVRVSMPPE